MQKLITKGELASLLGCSEWTLWQMRREGRLPPAVRVGKSLRWRPETVEAFLKKEERPAQEFDPVLCRRSEAAVAGRNFGDRPKKEGKRKKKGRPTKAESVEGRKA